MANRNLSFKVPYTSNKVRYLITIHHDQEGMVVFEDGSLIHLQNYPVWFSMRMSKGFFVEEYGIIVNSDGDIRFIEITCKEFIVDKQRLTDAMLFENLLNDSPSVSLEELQKITIPELKK